MNFIEEYIKGQAGQNQGLYMGDGCKEISKTINGLQKSMIYGLAAGPKAGKTTLADYAFVIEPYLDSLKTKTDFEIIYNSYEIDRVSKEFDFAAHFLNKDYKMEIIQLEGNTLENGNNYVELSAKYLRGRLQDDEGNFIPVKKTVEDVLKEVYSTRIIPLFGEYGTNGLQIKPGVIQFYGNRNNPTGIRNNILSYAEKNGTFAYETFKGKDGTKGKRIIGYTSNNPNKTVLIITDHLRKILLERINGTASTLKQCIDKYLEYSVEIRNWCGFSFLHIIHLNRSMSDMNRIKYAGDLLFPNGDDVKDRKQHHYLDNIKFIFTFVV